MNDLQYHTARHAADVVALLRQLGWKLTIAESCTGGTLASAITDVEGSSDVFDAGYVTYSVGAKRHLANAGKHPALHRAIDDHGVYSPQTALGMAQAARKAAGYDQVAIGVTGMLTEGHPDMPTFHGAVVDVVIVVQGDLNQTISALRPPEHFRLTLPFKEYPNHRGALKEMVVRRTLRRLKHLLEEPVG